MDAVAENLDRPAQLFVRARIHNLRQIQLPEPGKVLRFVTVGRQYEALIVLAGLPIPAEHEAAEPEDSQDDHRHNRPRSRSGGLYPTTKIASIRLHRNIVFGSARHIDRRTDPAPDDLPTIIFEAGIGGVSSNRSRHR